MTKREPKHEEFLFSTEALQQWSAMPNFFAQSVQAYQLALLEFQKEAAAFLNERLCRDLETAQSLAEGRTFPDVLKVQQDWFTATLRAYSDETRKLMEIAGRAAVAGVKPADTPNRSQALAA